MEETTVLTEAELAERLGRKKNTIRVWTKRHDDPLPRLGPGRPLFYWPDVLDWLRRTGKVAQGLNKRAAHRGEDETLAAVS